MKEILENIKNHKLRRNKMKIGKAKYGFTQKKFFKLKDGENTFRILPPIGDLADEGRWSVYCAVHYGYKNSKGKLRVFQSPEVVNRKTKMVEVPDAASDRIKKLKLELDKAKESGNKAMVEKLLKLVGPNKPLYNLDKNHYMNAIDTQGNIGVLKLRYKAKLSLDAQIKKLREKGIDPLSVDNGRFFVFTRSGTGLDTTFQVEIAQETLAIPNVGEVKRDIVHKLSDELIARLDSEAAELHKLFKAPTSEEVDKIVKMSDLMTGVSPAIDELFDTKSNDVEQEEIVDEEEEEEVLVESKVEVVETKQELAKVEVAKVVEAPKVVETPKVEAVKPVQETKVVSSQVQQTTAQQLSEMSDEDFLKSLGL